MYEKAFGLQHRPFDLTPNPRQLLLTPQHREALSNLEYGITARKGITVLTGEAGTGKTTLVRRVLSGGVGTSGMTRPGRFAYLANPTMDRREFVEYLATAFRLPGEARTSKARFLIELERVLLEDVRARALSALVVDEAQSMPDELLEEIRLLANIESDTDKLLPVVLVGQPELADRLNGRSLRQLKQRVALRCSLEPLNVQETASYIATRISLAGGDAARLFTRDAVLAVHARSRGIPRLISVICDNALLTAFAVDRCPVGADIIAEVGGDFHLDGSAPVERARDPSHDAGHDADEERLPAALSVGPRDAARYDDVH